MVSSYNIFPLNFHPCSLLLFSGVDETFIQCWIRSLEDHLKTNQEAVEKAKKYDEMEKQVELLKEKFLGLKDVYDMFTSTNVPTNGETSHPVDLRL